MSEEPKKEEQAQKPQLIVIYLNRTVLGGMDRLATTMTMEQLLSRWTAEEELIKLSDLTGVLRGQTVWLNKRIIDGFMPFVDGQ